MGTVSHLSIFLRKLYNCSRVKNQQATFFRLTFTVLCQIGNQIICYLLKIQTYNRDILKSLFIFRSAHTFSHIWLNCPEKLKTVAECSSTGGPFLLVDLV